MEHSFNCGDRVRCIEDRPDGNPDIVVGSTGTIVCLATRIGVRWDESVKGGHECATMEGVHCESGYGWFVDPPQIELLRPPKEEENMEIDRDAWGSLIGL